MAKHTTHEAVYVRVSSDEQSTASQMPELDAWAASRREAGHTVVFYTDKFSGRTMKRPGWDKLMAAMRAGQVTTIAVWRLDRLGRTTSGLSTLCDELLERDINLVSLKDGFDLGTATGRLMFNVLASMAQFETEIRGERVRAGIAAAKAKGKTWGGSKTGERRQITARQIRRVQEQHVAGNTVTDIARMNEVSRATVYRIIEDMAGATNG